MESTRFLLRITGYKIHIKSYQLLHFVLILLPNLIQIISGTKHYRDKLISRAEKEISGI